MADELMHVIPMHKAAIEVVMPPAEQVPLPPGAVGTQTPDEVQASEAAFRHEQQGHHPFAGLVGMWAGTLLLHDLARDHFDEPEDEDEERPRLEDRSHP